VDHVQMTAAGKGVESIKPTRIIARPGGTMGPRVNAAVSTAGGGLQSLLASANLLGKLRVFKENGISGEPARYTCTHRLYAASYGEPLAAGSVLRDVDGAELRELLNDPRLGLNMGEQAALRTALRKLAGVSVDAGDSVSLVHTHAPSLHVTLYL
jgi:hypothetical protein